ncbi:D-beta-hydroxybutyrate dehydrogenase, mitochondrial-like [Panonychus citri]|uniref:D-beta-hydroxybutyrate dehydrogenase, mitochondrial-like n=1 Tax=Panonychus citri TaxID=50023 RepID=UPI0023073968|nr:D-beta-hydroxybutyrate dehydrogenase, mitochondrial-like [Panonychus citri]
MLPLLSIIFVLTFAFLYKYLVFIPLIFGLFRLIGSTIVFISFSWLIAKLIHNYISSRLLGPIPASGKAIFITGCDSGFGYGSALELNKKGFRVFAGCLFPEGKGAKGLRSSVNYKDKLHIIKIDVTKDEDIEKAFETISEQLTKSGDCLWGIVNNAGIPRVGKCEWGSFDDHYGQCFDVNVYGVVKVTRTMLPLLRMTKGSRVVTISSINSRMTFPDTSAYSMTKAALTPFQDALRSEVDSFGIKVISVEPSFAATPILEQSRINSLYNKIYDDSTLEVKKAYPNSDKLTNGLQLLQAIPNKYLSMDKTYEIVINNIVKSLTDYEPPYRLTCCPLVISILYSIYPILPSEWTHLILGKWLVKLSQIFGD